MFIAIIDEELLREKIVKLAILQRHKEYKHGYHGPDYFDCAGFVWYVYHEVLGIDIYEEGKGKSTTTKIMTSKYGTITFYDEGVLKDNLNLIKKGDILLFHRQDMKENKPKDDNKYPGHCGIYISDNKFIHAPRTVGCVVISTFDKINHYWEKKLIASKNIIDR